MTTFSPEFIAAKIKFGALLEQYGWTPVDEREQDWAVGTASKEVESITNPITVTAYFNPSSNYLALLGGTFTTTMWLPVPHNVTDSELAELALKFAEEAEHCIGQIWTVGLLRKRQAAEQEASA